METGLITLIGATTENPLFEVIAPLLSRCRVITLKMLSPDDISAILKRALNDKEMGLGNTGLILDRDALLHLVDIADGDARVALNGLEVTASLIVSEGDHSGSPETRQITLQDVEKALHKKALLYDKS